ncbi:MAG TPA: ABC transporter ATP-binding protein [Chloroflexota bacterium]|nr:ABC transporter ATP-binding protein [Chloroflexota bacterium]
MDAIMVEGLSKQYGKVVALRDLNLTVAEGVVFGLLGPNGAGKSTLIKALVGALTPSSGKARVLGLDPLRDRRDLRRRIGYMPQEPALYSDLSARENIAFFARAHDLPNLEGCVDDVLTLTDLGDRADDPVRTFSGGMQRRVSLACALAHRPRVLFLDEPTAAVDPVLRARFWRTFREMATTGVTLFISTHLMDEALLCDQVAVVRAGETVITGPPKEILDLGKTRLTFHRGAAVERQTIGGHPEDLAAALHARGLAAEVTAIEIERDTLEAVIFGLIAPQEQENHG